MIKYWGNIKGLLVLFCLVFTGLDKQMSFSQNLSERLSQLDVIREELRDWSDSTTILIPKPECALVNVKNIDAFPSKKNVNLEASMEVYDGNGNFFEKRIILKAQGNSSMYFEKKNFSVEFCEDMWEGNKTTDIVIGDWVVQDSYHFKAYYTDFLRGIGAVGYKLYDQISENRGWIRDRSGMKTNNGKARCYPDGFPCVVYLNGEFYGIYSWQLKKNRKNMNLSKNIAEHIHLDGTLLGSAFWNGKIDWTQFEVRNPKTLYTSDGREYDGEHPSELLDENTDFYDLGTDDMEIEETKRRTVTVKHYIEEISGLNERLKEMVSAGLSSEVIKTEIEKHFDIPGLIDYVCFYFMTNNYDGNGKNWQWFTYDGVKWYVAPYDLDGLFGCIWNGAFAMPPTWNWIQGDLLYYTIRDSANGPLYWIRTYYMDDVKKRYVELRNCGIFTTENIMSLVEDWYQSVGEENYFQEQKRWADSPCYGETICNPNWETIDDWSGYDSLLDYENSSTYQEGDRCRLGYRIWIATGETTGVAPYSKMGYTDSIGRLKSWVNTRIKLEDEYMGYEERTGILERNHSELSSLLEYRVYNVSGIRLPNLCKGVNILKYADGHSKKIVIR